MAGNKLIFSLIFILFAIKLTNSQHMQQTYTDEEHPPLTPKDHLFMFTINGFHNLTSYYVNSAANISELILKDATLNSDPSNLVIGEFKKNLTDFLQKYEKYKEFEDLFELVELYSNTTSDYYEIPRAKETKESLKIVNVLRKYGSEKLDKEFEKLYDNFVGEFKEEFEKVKIYLEKPMIDWFVEFKGITHMNERTEAFEKFVMFYI